MIKYDDWFVPLQAGLSAYTRVPTIQAETKGKQPPYPFIAIKQTTIATPIGMPALSTSDGTQTIEQDYEMVLSLTIHAKTIESATDNANKARNYFLSRGAIDLSDANIAMVEVMPATNRDVFLNIDYERRVGFDVRLRVRDKETFVTDVIEKVTYKMEVESE